MPALDPKQKWTVSHESCAMRCSARVTLRAEGAEVKEGAFTVASASNDFFAAQNAGELVAPLTRQIIADINSNSSTTASYTQKQSTRWPEKYLTDDLVTGGLYAAEFRTLANTTAAGMRPAFRGLSAQLPS